MEGLNDFPDARDAREAKKKKSETRTVLRRLNLGTRVRQQGSLSGVHQMTCREDRLGF